MVVLALLVMALPRQLARESTQGGTGIAEAWAAETRAGVFSSTMQGPRDLRQVASNDNNTVTCCFEEINHDQVKANPANRHTAGTMPLPAREITGNEIKPGATLAAGQLRGRLVFTASTLGNDERGPFIQFSIAKRINFGSEYVAQTGQRSLIFTIVFSLFAPKGADDAATRKQMLAELDALRDTMNTPQRTATVDCTGAKVIFRALSDEEYKANRICIEAFGPRTLMLNDAERVFVRECTPFASSLTPPRATKATARIQHVVLQLALAITRYWHHISTARTHKLKGPAPGDGAPATSPRAAGGGTAAPPLTRSYDACAGQQQGQGEGCRAWADAYLCWDEHARQQPTWRRWWSHVPPIGHHILRLTGTRAAVNTRRY